nr:hypothetical protein [Methylomonas methanica]
MANKWIAHFGFDADALKHIQGIFDVTPLVAEALFAEEIGESQGFDLLQFQLAYVAVSLPVSDPQTKAVGAQHTAF